MVKNNNPILLVEDDPNDVFLWKRACALGANSYLVIPAAFEKLQQFTESIIDFWIYLNQSTASFKPSEG